MRPILLLGVAIASFLSPVFATPVDGCKAIYDLEFNLHLVNAAKGSEGNFVGEFELVNNFHEDIVLLGHFQEGSLELAYPDVLLETDSLSGWIPLPHPPGTFLPAPDKRRVSVGGKATFVAALPDSGIVTDSGLRYRLVLRLSEPGICIVSKPFNAIQDRGPVKGYRSGAL